jgi:alpha-beta hydrolase superfamily lysophospholipase
MQTVPPPPLVFELQPPLLTEETMSLRYDQLAFSSLPPAGFDFDDEKKSKTHDDLVTAVARSEFQLSDGGPVLNIELFGSGWHEGQEIPSNNLLLFVPGVCESAETWTVQHIANVCQKAAWRLAVLELPGHGLSGGPRAVLQPTGQKGLNRFVDTVVEAACHVLDLAINQSQSDTAIKIALSGSSLGGVLAAYASPKLAKEIQNRKQQASTCHARFVGNFLLSPAVGVAQAAVPPPMIVSALSCLAYVAPSAAFMTPTEDPSHYSCPSWTQRNYSGQWPLGTSKLLLDITSSIVPDDVKKAMTEKIDDDNPLHCACCKFRCIVISGAKDPVVPLDTVRQFVNGVKSCQNIETSLDEIPKGDHGLLAQANSKSVDLTRELLEKVLKELAS